MKKMYCYEGELEKRANRMNEAGENDVVAEMLAEQLGIDEKCTVGEVLLASLSYILDVPRHLFDKPLDELTKDEAALLDKKFRTSDMVTFVQE